ncbi:MAG: FapA family protein, partial [Bacillota bacterium]
ISKGINGGGKHSIYVGGNLKCKYIEHANIHVEGNISADYIIDSNVTCMGNIELAGTKEIVVGGEVKVLGELKAKDIGSESERTTKIEVIGIKIMDTESIEKLTKDRDELSAKLQMLVDNAGKLSQARMSANDEIMEQMSLIKKQILIIREKVEEMTHQIQQLEKNWTMEYKGSIACKRKLYQGVKINFGEQKFHFEFDNLDHCRIFWSGNEIIQGTL